LRRYPFSPYSLFSKVIFRSLIISRIFLSYSGEAPDCQVISECIKPGPDFSTCTQKSFDKTVLFANHNRVIKKATESILVVQHHCLHTPTKQNAFWRNPWHMSCQMPKSTESHIFHLNSILKNLSQQQPTIETDSDKTLGKAFISCATKKYTTRILHTM